MLIFLWFTILIIALITLVKSTDWFVESSEKIALALKVSPFIIAITLVALGTSLPELMTSLVAVLKGKTEIAVANAIGSNIANIFLIIGLSSIAARRLIVKRDLLALYCFYNKII
ncbi:MAG: sodium:calcium antiporter [Patescibacteria group bacterium]